MKKIISLLLTLTLFISVFAISSSAYLGSWQTSLINSADLTPLRTGFTPLDDLVDDLFDAWFTDDMTPYQKLKKCYDFLVYGSSYGTSTRMSVYSAINSECNYYSDYDRRYCAEAYCFIRSKIGSCNDFAGAFMVFARALGFECYVMDGTITWYRGTNDHVWCLIRFSDGYYCFDPQAEWRNYDNNGSVSYSNFCIPEYSQSSRSYSRSQNISKFNMFRCRNKVNEPGATRGGQTEPPQEIYSIGFYATDDTMNFRSGHSIYSDVLTLIAPGTTLEVTETYGEWGKIDYNGLSGWMSLDYSIYLGKDDPAEEGIAGDADGDGEVTSSDARLILRFAVGLETLSEKNQKLADLNGDGEVDTSDARLALRKSVNLD